MTESQEKPPLLLAIDIGTQSVRGLLFDLDGTLVAKQQRHIEPYFSAQPGWAEQDAELYWQEMGLACQALWNEQGCDPGQVVGISLTTQRDTMVNVDASGKPLRPAMVWLDQRRATEYKPVGGFWVLAFKGLGLGDTLRNFQEEAEANWIAQHQPDIWAATEKFVFLSGFLTYRMVGSWVDSVANQVGFVPFDYKKLDWAAQSDWKWQAVCVRREQLPDLRQPGSKLGDLTEMAGRHLGLSADIPVIASGADKACEVLGSGVVEPGMAALSFGTTATINTTTEKYHEVVRFLPPYPAAVPGSYSTEVQIYRGFWMVSWFKEQFAYREKQMADEQGVEAEMLFDDLLKDIPPGSMGLTLQPYWSPGVRMPGPEGKGSIIGFGDVHTRAHIYRSILEGLAYGLREGLEATEKRTGTKIKKLRVAGGGSQSDAAMQITADVFGLPAERPHIYETSGLGAAINIAVGLGLHPDFDTAVARMTRAGDCFEPNPDAVAVYEQLYRRVYQRMYKRLQPLYKDIREITGYPA